MLWQLQPLAALVVQVKDSDLIRDAIGEQVVAQLKELLVVAIVRVLAYI